MVSRVVSLYGYKDCRRQQCGLSLIKVFECPSAQTGVFPVLEDGVSRLVWIIYTAKFLY